MAAKTEPTRLEWSSTSATRRPQSAFAPTVHAASRVKSARRHSAYGPRTNSGGQPTVPVESRTYSTMKIAGMVDEEESEPTVSGREGWWRQGLKPTPTPGSYNIPDFLQELQEAAVPSTYNFLQPDRQTVICDPKRTGSLLVPGLYGTEKHQKFGREVGERPATYRFKTVERKDAIVIGPGVDRQINLSPDTYSPYKLKPEAPSSCTHHMFLSRDRGRFTDGPFNPKKDGSPGPGKFEIRSSFGKTWHRGGTSSFMSAVPRLASRRTPVPGPGSYTPSDPNPLPPSFFSSYRKSRSKSALVRKTQLDLPDLHMDLDMDSDCSDSDDDVREGEKKTTSPAKTTKTP